MKKNFNIRDGVHFDFLGESFDLRGDCELVSVVFRPGKYPSVAIKWRIESSNQQIHITFKSVEGFIVRSRDVEYPVESGATLAISGFSNGLSYNAEDQFYVEPTQDMNYMSFVMNDMSAFLVKAESASMHRV